MRTRETLILKFLGQLFIYEIIIFLCISAQCQRKFSKTYKEIWSMRWKVCGSYCLPLYIQLRSQTSFINITQKDFRIWVYVTTYKNDIFRREIKMVLWLISTTNWNFLPFCSVLDRRDLNLYSNCSQVTRQLLLSYFPCSQSHR